MLQHHPAHTHTQTHKHTPSRSALFLPLVGNTSSRRAHERLDGLPWQLHGRDTVGLTDISDPARRRHFWCCRDNSVNSTLSSQKKMERSVEYLSVYFGLQLRRQWIGGNRNYSSLSVINEYYEWINREVPMAVHDIPLINLTICMSPGCNHKESRGPSK